MKRGKRWLSMLLAVAMVVSLSTTALAASGESGIKDTGSRSKDLFHDVAETSWYYDWVKSAYELGLMIGDTNGQFRPDDTVTVAETVTLAARLHLLAAGTEYEFKGGNVWFRPYVDYALAHGILAEEMDNYRRPATRLEYAQILSNAMPDSALKAINKVEDGAIPDVAAEEAVYRLYRAGIMIGKDEKGTFCPDENVKRSEVSTAAVRFAQPELRESIELTVEKEPSFVPPAVPVTPVVPTVPSTPTVPEIPGEPAGEEEETPAEPENPEDGLFDENNGATAPYDVVNPDAMEDENTRYSTDHILIKLRTAPSESLSAKLTAAGIVSMEPYMEVSSGVWYRAGVNGDVQTVMEAVRALPAVLVAEYDFAYSAGTIIESETIVEHCHDNKHWHKQWHLRSCGVQKAWEDEVFTENNAAPGTGTVVAVIDTGVDYTHEDLAGSIWINTDEIPGNRIDDDKNGYVDDYYGVNTIVSNTSSEAGNVMDDHGHGTHVAGIVAAANNNLGVVGVAYGAKIMIIKAGQSSGYFNQSDLAEAIIYAYENGADVINMSLGGAASSISVQDALETAYTRCVLVASAGNDGKPNEATDNYKKIPDYQPTYPAALKYVMGVMSVDEKGVESSFTNWDRSLYNTVEYELYAPGNEIYSTLPNNGYAAWSGTSMAAPVVSAVAAILRSAYPDRESYPTKFIYGQLVGTSETHATCINPSLHAVNGGPHNLAPIVDIHAAMTKLPTPDVGVTEWTIFDDPSISSANNGDGVVDAGETIALGFTLRNRWGMSKDTTVTVDTLSTAGISCPYVTINGETAAAMNYGSIGTYSDGDCGKIYDEDGVWIGWQSPFLLEIAKNCPNDYTISFNVSVSCGNALNEADESTYTSEYGGLRLMVRRGVLLTGTIEEDMTLTADNYYIISDSTYIPAGVTVTVEPGTQIQFWTDDPGDAYAELPIVALNVDGTLLCNGTEDDPISIFPSEGMSQYRVEINAKNKGVVKLYHTKVVNPYGVITYAENCEFTQYYPAKSLAYRYLSGSSVEVSTCGGDIRFVLAENCSFRQLGGENNNYAYLLTGQFDGCLFADCFIKPRNDGASFVDCVFYGNNNYMDGTAGGTSSVRVTMPDEITVEKTVTDPSTGTAYLIVRRSHLRSSVEADVFSAFAGYLGGHLLYVETEAEQEFLENNHSGNGNDNYLVGLYQDPDDGKVTWMDGSAVGDFLEYTCAGNETVGVWNPWHDSWTVGSYAYADLQGAYIYSAIIEIPSTDVEEISLNRYEVIFDTDAAGWQIEATSSPSGSANAVLIFESQNEAVAKVDETGYVTFVGAGETEIRVYSPDRYVYNTLTVTVKEAVALESISLGDAIRLPVGESKQLHPVYTPADTTKQYLTYTSSAPEVVSVSAGGVITAHGVGSAIITATNPETGKFAVVTVTGYIPAAAVTAEEPLVLLHKEGEETVEALGVTVSPANATDKTLIWESSNPEILTVDTQGKLIKGGKGVATLRATLTGTDLYAEITVCLADVDPAVTVVRMERNQCNIGQCTYALLSDGTLWYWDGTVNLPVKIMEYVTDFAVGYHNNGKGSMLVVDTSGVLNVYHGSLGSWTVSNAPLGGTSRGNVVKVAATKNNFSFYFLTADGAVWAWGNNSYGQLGDGTTTDRSEAVQIPMETKVTSLATPNSSVAQVLLLDENGNVWICGGNGKYLNPTVTEEKVVALHQGERVILEFADAVRIGSTDKPKQGVDWTELPGTALYYVTEDGSVYGWGSNGYGQLGDGTTNSSYDMYVQMEKITNAADIFGLYHNVYIQTADGKFYGVGQNDAHQIPNLTDGDQTVPSRIFFGLETNENTPTYTANVAEGVLADAALILDCDQAMVRGTAFGNMQMVDSDGNVIGLKRTIRLDKVAITPMSGSFTAGETYTLTIPENGLANQFGVGVSADTITFIVSAAAEEGEENSGEEQNSSEEQSNSEEQADDQEIVPEEAVPVVHETQINPDVTRVVKNEEYYLAQWESYKANGINPMFYGNVILNRLVDDDVTKWLRPQGAASSVFLTRSVTGNYWGTVSETLINKQIVDFNDFTTLLDLNPGTILTAIPETVWPVVTKAGLLDKDGNEVSSIGNETVTFFVEFNRDMDTSIALDVRFGSYYPYADYQVEGEWITPRRWEGTTTLTTIIENGYQYWSISNGKAADAPLKLYEDWGRFSFEIDTTSALAMTLQGEAGDEGITLTWTQDDFETLAGYNVYRSDVEDGLYQRLNSAIIPADTKTFFDSTVEPGKVYYYNFTVVKTDLSESEPSGKITIRSKDTMAPVMYHTPVYEAYAGSSLVITATVTDNVGVERVTLYYRVPGAESWSTATMTKLNDKFSAVIGANLVTVEGLEYYLEAYDGISSVYRGSAEEPYAVMVKEPVTNQSKGDVNGDGRITLLDALMLLQAVNDRLNLDAEQFARADLDGSGALSAAEALKILQYVNGKIGSLT